MTGLSLVEDALVEIAVIVTDSELNPIGAGIEIVIKPPASALSQMSDFVRDMHITSGLLPLLESGTTLDDAQSRLLDYLKECGVESGKSPICGNSIWVDRNFIARDLPKVSEYLHYRSVDVSSIKELARRWYPRVYFNAPKRVETIALLATSKTPSQNFAITALQSLLQNLAPRVKRCG